MSAPACRCCGLSAPTVTFHPGYQSCLICAPSQAAELLINRIWDQFELRAQIKRMTRAGRADTRREGKLARYDLAGGKRCSACWHRLPIAEFGNCKSHGDGLQQVCRLCNGTQTMIYSKAPQGTARAAWHAYRNARRLDPAAVPPSRDGRQTRAKLIGA